jgi:peptidoglycan/LPS O-acetylase OafA/YrhL
MSSLAPEKPFDPMIAASAIAAPSQNPGMAADALKRLPQLDGLRGVAVSLVVLFHYAPNLPVIGYVASRGWIGVDLFFVLSGFLIGGIVIDNRTSENFVSVFYTRRFLRIFPLYYLLLCFVLLMMSIGMLEQHELFSYFLYIQNFVSLVKFDPGPTWLQPTWSLAIEEQFYLFLPLAIAIAPKRIGPVFIAGILIAASLRAAGYLIPLQNPKLFSLFFTPCRADGLFYGVLLALMVRKVEDWRPIIPLLYTGAVVSLCLFLLVHNNEAMLFTIGVSALGPLFFCSLALSLFRGPVARTLVVPPLPWLGIRAYAIYLVHMPALLGVRMIFDAWTINPQNLIKPIALVLTLVCSALSWRYLEAPLIRLGHTLKYRVPEPAGAGLASI